MPWMFPVLMNSNKSSSSRSEWVGTRQTVVQRKLTPISIQCCSVAFHLHNLALGWFQLHCVLPSGALSPCALSLCQLIGACCSPAPSFHPWLSVSDVTLVESARGLVWHASERTGRLVLGHWRREVTGHRGFHQGWACIPSMATNVMTPPSSGNSA